MRSELPELARTRHHWVVLLRPPHKYAAIGLALMLIWGLFAHAVLFVLVLLVGVVLFQRHRVWRAEVIILTRKRVIRVQGVPETTRTEASLRIERVSGARLIQTVPGKMLGYGTIELEAPGDHPDVRRLKKIADPHRFYDRLRSVVFGDLGPARSLDPDDFPPAYDTEPLPRLPAPKLPPKLSPRGPRHRR
jgi:hypothetical protein